MFPEESTMSIFSQTSLSSAPWLATGEVSIGQMSSVSSFGGTDDSLLLSSSDGAISQMYLGDGSLREMAARIPGHDGHEWHSSCSLPSGSIVRLALKSSGR